MLKWHGVAVHGRLFDTMLAHSLIEPDMRHGMDYLAEACLGYAPLSAAKPMDDTELTQGNLGETRSA